MPARRAIKKQYGDQRKEERVGSARKTHPLPMRLRHAYIPREQGGAEGYRGRGWPKARAEALKRDRLRSTITGLTTEQGQGLQVDHIHPYRLGGKNRLSNLRTVDASNHKEADHMKNAGERPPIRDRRW